MDNLNVGHPFRKALFLLLIAGAFYFFLDRELLPLIGKAYKPLFRGVSSLISPPIHLAIWGGAFLIARIKQSRWTLPLFEIITAQCLSVAFARLFKIIIGRARPEFFLKTGAYGFYGFKWSGHYHSFPSGHTLMAFTLATSLSLIFPRFRFLFYPLAALFSLSRIFLFKHYFSDVIGTAAIGIVLASTVHIMTRRTIYETV